ncbi:ricin-type beta-trefoil lectin domain protein [Streptomyces sp. NBC_01754]|uniref:ricin-type beta-trefoil lectin domain protein n=1 Tax=Streptomyces sp. NBC_01754 TaxID=2975930 RepID=UPI002DDA7581|nr:ricin-type beta-trefoil lectin domain protein [Streptomyces sp. NBC_01754]WSC90828.1 ricin-type beta-trefoil lectin domain protein [Streptomyces sp. NBC_01754]WSC96677.1 ricin-type beta-trefoil lectin domain protein [Streptomyces sp. NBC_01754]
MLIAVARERANLQDRAAAVFLHQYGELLKLYCARANPHNVHRQMLTDYENTLRIRELNDATNAALEKMAGLTEELQTLREDRDEERRQRITLQQQIHSLRSQNQARAAEKKTALAERDQLRADLTTYESDQQLEKWQPGAEQDGPYAHHPDKPVVVPLSPPSGRTKRRGLVLALIVVGAVVLSLTVYGVTQFDDNHGKNTQGSGGSSPDPTTPITPPVAGGGLVTGGSSSNGGRDADTSGGTSGGASGGNTTGGSSDAGASSGNNGSAGPAGATSTPPASSGYFQLRDVGYGKCLSATSIIQFATCTDSPVTNWTAKKAGSGSSYTLYNESTGQCLAVNINMLIMAACDSNTNLSWRTGTSSTLVNLHSSLCLDESAGWPILASCEPSKPTQHWAKK